MNNPDIERSIKESIKILARRDLSLNELSEILSKKGFSVDIIDNTVGFLHNNNLYCEKKSAMELARSKIRYSKIGPVLLTKFLEDKRFPEYIIKETVEQIYIDFSEYGLACELAEKKISGFRRKYASEPEKIKFALKNLLARKGFSEYISDNVLETLTV